MARTSRDGRVVQSATRVRPGEAEQHKSVDGRVCARSPRLPRVHSAAGITSTNNLHWMHRPVYQKAIHAGVRHRQHRHRHTEIFDSRVRACRQGRRSPLSLVRLSGVAQRPNGPVMTTGHGIGSRETRESIALRRFRSDDGLLTGGSTLAAADVSVSLPRGGGTGTRQCSLEHGARAARRARSSDADDAAQELNGA